MTKNIQSEKLPEHPIAENGREGQS